MVKNLEVDKEFINIENKKANTFLWKNEPKTCTNDSQKIYINNF